MNYFELINKCLTELNYKTCSSFSDLVKNDHEKIKNILNIINAEVCGLDNWNFLLRKMQIDLPANTGEIVNTIPGRIHSLYIDNVKYEFISNFDKFLQNKQPSNSYSVFNDMILVPQSSSAQSIEIIYYTNNFAQNIDGEDLSSMSSQDDASVIPYPFVEPILVYGTCMRVKGNPEYSKFSYWYGMYKDSLSNLRSKIGACAFDSPEIIVKRR